MAFDLGLLGRESSGSADKDAKAGRCVMEQSDDWMTWVRSFIISWLCEVILAEVLDLEL
jgi:hypothetical protein